MKKIIFLFAMLASVAASAQSHISIQMLGTTYTASPMVKFRISWGSVPTITGETHNAKIWVWVDFLKVNADNTTSGNTWTRAEISGTPTVSSSPSSTATLDASGNKGFWLNGVTGSYSATVTATLSNIPSGTKFNGCAYTSDCPPNVTAANGSYTFKGTPPFTLIAANGTTQIVTGTTLATSALTITPTTIRDKTECPGDFCIYTGSDLHIDATHLCQQRTSGAKNWEAYILDARDSKIYRIVQMPDDKWYFAQDLDYRNGSDYAYNASYCSTYIYGVTAANSGTVCPSSWDVPTSAIWTQLMNTIDPNPNCWSVFWPTAEGGTDVYGFKAAAHCVRVTANGTTWYKLTTTGSTATRNYWTKAGTCQQLRLHKYYDGCFEACLTNYPPAHAPIRCVRQL